MLKKILIAFFICTISILAINTQLNSWGFWAHKKINRMAVFTLPPDMIGFYKKHIDYVSEHAVDPDKLVVVNEEEHSHHYLDADRYGKEPFKEIPRKWKDAVAKFTEDTLMMHGIVPWWIEKMMFRLTQAFKDQDVDKILYNSAFIGHYIGDANVPLHNTKFYNGHNAAEKGIHGFFESRIPELFGDDFDYLLGRAEYLEKPSNTIWNTCETSFSKVDSIYLVWEKMTTSYSPDQMYTFENRGQTMKKNYSLEFSKDFNATLNNLVERRMRTSVKMVGSIWYTCWVLAGQPDLSGIEDKEVSETHKKEMEEKEQLWKTGKPKGRIHDE